MTVKEFHTKAVDVVLKYAQEQLNKGQNYKPLTEDNIHIVWHGYILGSQKALLTTDLPDGMYYEVTYNKRKNEIYFDAYKRWENRRIEL